MKYQVVEESAKQYLDRVDNAAIEVLAMHESDPKGCFHDNCMGRCRTRDQLKVLIRYYATAMEVPRSAVEDRAVQLMSDPVSGGRFA